MKKLKKSWAGVVMGAMLVGTLVGVVWARPHDTPEAQDITRKITVPGAFFHPHVDGVDWYNNGYFISVQSGRGVFTAPVVFPCLPSVTVERLTLYASDANATKDACAFLVRTRPQHGDSQPMGTICSSDTTTGVEPFVDSNINPDVVWPSHGVYLWLVIQGPNIDVHAARVEYHRNI